MPKQEYFNGTEWVTSESSGADLSVNSGASVPITGSLNISSGSVNMTLGDELEALSTLSQTGLVTRTGVGSYTGRTLIADSGINIVNGDAISGNPTIGLGTVPISSLQDFPSDSTKVLNGNGEWVAPSSGSTTLTGAVSGSGIGTINTSLNTTLNNVPSPTGNVSMNSKKITSLATPQYSSDAATKGYVDGLVPTGTKYYGSFKRYSTSATTIGTNGVIPFDNRVDASSTFDISVGSFEPNIGVFTVTSSRSSNRFRIYTMLSVGSVSSDWFNDVVLQWEAENSSGATSWVDCNYDLDSTEANTTISFFSFTGTGVSKLRLRAYALHGKTSSLVIKKASCSIEEI